MSKNVSFEDAPKALLVANARKNGISIDCNDNKPAIIKKLQKAGITKLNTSIDLHIRMDGTVGEIKSKTKKSLKDEWPPKYAKLIKKFEVKMKDKEIDWDRKLKKGEGFEKFMLKLPHDFFKAQIVRSDFDEDVIAEYKKAFKL